MRRATLTAIVTLTTLLPLPGWAMAPTRAGVLPLEVHGKLPPNGVERFSATIDEGLASSGVTVVTAAELAKVAPGTALDTCTDEACLRGLATETSTDRLVRPSVQLQESDYLISLAVIDGASGRELHLASKTCELCGLSEALAMASELASSLEGPLTTPPTGTVTIESTPAGAQVWIDGELAGTTPLEIGLAPGEHTIVVRDEGYEEETRQVTVEAGASTSWAAELAQVAAEPRVDRSALLRPIGWASLGVGIAALGSGIALLAVDERPVQFTRCSGPDVDAEGNCRFRHNTLGGGIVMTIVGVLGITAGALLVVRTNGERGKGSDRRARLRPTSNGIALHF